MWEKMNEKSEKVYLGLLMLARECADAGEVVSAVRER